MKNEAGMVADRETAATHVWYRTESSQGHHQCFLTIPSLQTKEDLQGTSIFYQKISAFLACTWLPDVVWWRAELANLFQNQLCPLLPEIPSVLLNCITAVNPDPQVLYRNAWTSGDLFSDWVQ